MNKYLLLSAAAAMAATAGGRTAQASTTVFFQSDNGGLYCDYFVINHKGTLYAGQHVGGAYCGTSVFFDAGLRAKGKMPRFGNKTPLVAFGDSTLAVSGIYDALLIVFSLPLGQGGEWAVLYSSNGLTTYVLNAGKQFNAVHPGRKSNTSTISSAIAALKLTKKK